MVGAIEGVGVSGVGPGGTDHALAHVYKMQYGALVGTARLLLDDRESAEEVVQEASARTWAALDRLRAPEDPLPYVRRAVVNLARSGLRRRRTVRTTPLHAVPDAMAADVLFAHDEARRELAGAVRALPRRQRECVVLRYYLDCSTAQTAETLGIAEGSVKATLHHALTALGVALEDPR